MKTSFRARLRYLSLLAVLGLPACAGQPGEHSVVASQKSAVELRSMQSRVFETADRTRVLRTTIATLQDMGYAIDKVDAQAATVSATKASQLRMSAAAAPRGTSQTVLRANAIVVGQSSDTQVDEPRFYQELFFAPLAQRLALASQDLPADAAAPLPNPPAATP
ncbi:hypothetical protein [Roseomonas elaeocarpi]|uniref:Lipoprotein n=1 Tax=Roseomonas elaeocarpi TaxID=907779 RepID=A0ABV6JT95_9PROT